MTHLLNLTTIQLSATLSSLLRISPLITTVRLAHCTYNTLPLHFLTGMKAIPLRGDGIATTDGGIYY